MPHKRSNYSPRVILYIASSNYLSELELEKFHEDLKSMKPKSNSAFKKILFDNFDVTRMISEPKHLADPILYNYLTYIVSPGSLKQHGYLNEYSSKVGAESLDEQYKTIPLEIILYL